VLENVNLSFYPDAKIGVLGVNGSGKSTLLRIMAGIDTEFVGEGFVAEGARVGYLEQEPKLDETKSVRENVMEGVAAKKAVLDRYNEIAANYSDETADEMAKLQDEIDSQNLWTSTARSIWRWMRCAVRRRRRGHQALRRRAPPRRAVQAAARPARPLVARRTDQPSRRGKRELAGRPSAQIPGAILIVTHDRYFSTMSPAGFSNSITAAAFPTRATTLMAQAKTKAPGTGIARGRNPAAHAATRERMDIIVPQGPAGEIQGALSAL